MQYQEYCGASVPRLRIAAEHLAGIRYCAAPVMHCARASEVGSAVANATTTVGKATAAAANATSHAAAAAGGSIGRATAQVANGTTAQIGRLKNASASVVGKLKNASSSSSKPAAPQKKLGAPAASKKK